MASVKVLQQIKSEIEEQSVGSEEVIEFIIENINIGQFTPEISSLFTKYPKLISLEFIDCGLKTLQDFPKLPNLMKLNFENNQLSDTCIKLIADQFPNLHFLGLSQNKIQKFDSLKDLYKIKELQQLDILDNPVSNSPKLREQLFTNCKNLEVVDGKDRNGQVVQFDDESEFDDNDDLSGGTDQQDDIDDDEVDSDDDDGEDDDDEDDEEEDVEPVVTKKTKQ